MRTFRAKYPIFASVIVLLLTILSNLIASGVLLLLGHFWPGIFDAAENEYAMQLLAELIMLALMTGVLLLFGMGYVLTRKGRGFLKSLAPGAAIIVIYVIAGLEMLILSMGQPLQSPGYFLVFLLCMAAIGMTEELIFRGLITEMIFQKYGKTPVGVWLSVVVSGMIFGCMHLINIAAGGAVTGVLVQVVAAACLGMCLSAIYLRGRNLWAVAALHGFMDFCALLSTGIFKGNSMLDAVGGYSAVNLLGALVYVALALFLLRKYHMYDLVGEAGNDKPTTLKLGVAVGLFSAITGAVFVLTI